MAAFKNQGSGSSGTTVAYGSRVLVIAAATYVADNFSVNFPSKTIERTNEIDEPSGQVSYVGFVTGSAQLQVPSSGGYPAQGAEFTTTVAGSSMSFYVAELGAPESKEGETKIPISFRKIIA